MITVNEIAELVGGTVKGDGEVRVSGISPCAFAEEGDMTFAFTKEDLEKAGSSRASCVLVPMPLEQFPKTALSVKDMKLAMTVIFNTMLDLKAPAKSVIHPSAIVPNSVKLSKNVIIGPNAVVGEKTQIGENTVIGPGCVIGQNVTIGQGSRLNPNVTIYDRVVMGSKVIVHSGTVIGADGFGYIPKDGKLFKVPQLGSVIIEDNVEIGANACIDRGTFDDTVIGRGTKIDNLVQIAHNVKIGRNVILAGNTAVAGSATVGDNTMVGGMVGISDHVNVGKNVKIGAKTGVTGHVKDNEVIFGYPHRKADDARKLHGLLSILLKHSQKLRKFLKTIPDGDE